MAKTIDDSLLLSYDDKQIFKKAQATYNPDLLQTLSIFSKEGKYEKQGNYYVFKTFPGSNIYYVSSKSCEIYGMFIDEHKKILVYSRFFFHTFEWFVTHIDNILSMVQNINLNDNIVNIGSNIVSMEKWFVTYGHFKDEIFIVTDYIDNINNTYKALVDYHTTDLPNYLANINYTTINNLLLKNSINAFSYKDKILKLNNLILIRHRTVDTTFHSFPINVRDKIMSSINNDNNILSPTNVVITRGTAMHMTRNLSNQMEIENYLSDNNFAVINPELMNYADFLHSIKNADKIVITWGGALVNLIYLKPHAQVYILKSQSYEHENLELFNKIIQTYKLNVKVIIHKNNIIDLVKLKKTIL